MAAGGAAREGRARANGRAPPQPRRALLGVRSPRRRRRRRNVLAPAARHAGELAFAPWRWPYLPRGRLRASPLDAASRKLPSPGSPSRARAGSARGRVGLAAGADEAGEGRHNDDGAGGSFPVIVASARPLRKATGSSPPLCGPSQGLGRQADFMAIRILRQTSAAPRRTSACISARSQSGGRPLSSRSSPTPPMAAQPPRHARARRRAAGWERRRRPRWTRPSAE